MNDITVKRLYNLKKWALYHLGIEIQFTSAIYFHNVYGYDPKDNVDLVFIGEDGKVQWYDSSTNQWLDHYHISEWETVWWSLS